MLNTFYKKFSLENLKKDKSSGQIATLLILIIVVVLIMVLVTVNLGQLSLSSTSLSNVADSAALSLASQLSSRANAISKSLVKACGDAFECCSTSWGFLSWLIITVVVIIVTVATWSYGTPAVIACATAAGAAAGVIASALAGTSIVQGALQGAMIGAAIAGGAEAGAGMSAGSGLFTESGVEAATAALAAGGGDAAGEAAFALAVSLPGAIAGGTLAVGSTLYNASVAEQNQSAAFSAASRALSGLPDYDRFRESVILQAFSQTVDDPNCEKVNGECKDPDDLNTNGIVDEKVSHFFYYWEARRKQVIAVIPLLTSATRTFYQTTLPVYRDYINSLTTAIAACEECPLVTGMLSRQEDPAGEDGSITKVARALEPPFWDPHSKGSFEQIVNGFKTFVKEYDDTMQLLTIDQLTSSWQTYIQTYYSDNYGQPVLDEDGNPVLDEDGNPKTITDVYHTIETVKNTLAGASTGWKDQIKNKRNLLEKCTLGTWDEDVCQPCGAGPFCANECIVIQPPKTSPIPCKLDYTPDGGQLILDSTINDEITPVVEDDGDIDKLVKKLSDLQKDIKQYVDDMWAIYNNNLINNSGFLPAVYKWNDSRCPDPNIACHSVTVTVGAYKVPRTAKTTSSNGWSEKTCIRLADSSDNGTNCNVTITREGPSNKELKSGRVSLGVWNPFISGKITKKGKAAYSYNSVRLAN